MDIINSIMNNCNIGTDTKVFNFVNLYGCTIGKSCIIGSFVEIQNDVIIGDKVKIESHSFICSRVQIEDEVFIGHHVVFTNDRYPRATNNNHEIKNCRDWKCEATIVKRGASIGSNATILPGITIGENAMIGAGSVVTKDVPPNTIVAGNPARFLHKI